MNDPAKAEEIRRKGREAWHRRKCRDGSESSSFSAKDYSGSES